MSQSLITKLRWLLVGSYLVAISVQSTQAQTTAFSYQGKLTDAGQPANGVYDLQFRLFDALVGGNQVGMTLIRDDVSVSNGIFTVTLNFGAAAFPDANRFLELGVRPGTSTGAFATLSPLQPVLATPYAVQSLNAANATTASTAVNFSGALGGDVSGTQAATTLSNNAVTTAKLADGSVTNAKIVDVAGNKITGAITTATLPGANVTGAVANATNATTAVNFSGALSGDVTGTQAATAISNNAVTTAKLADGSVTDVKIAAVAGSKITGTIPVAAVPTGSANYIQNATTPQAASDFNISGSGTAGGLLSGNAVNAVTQFNLNGARILSNAGTGNLFTGVSAGASNTTGSNNSFFGFNAGLSNSDGRENTFVGAFAGRATTGGGQICANCGLGGSALYKGSHNVFNGYLAGYSNTTGIDNSFFGVGAGYSNMTGGYNSFSGVAAGYSNTTGDFNSFSGYAAGYSNTIGYNNGFFGRQAGTSNTTGSNNSFSGSFAGDHNTTGDSNSFSGSFAGTSNTTGNGNSFSGAYAGYSNKTGSYNTALGYFADFGSGTLNNATAIGAMAKAACSNCLVLGSINGVNAAEADTNVGIGTTTPLARLDVRGDSLVSGNLGLTGNAGIGTTTPAAKLHVANNASTDILVETAGGTNAWARLNLKTTNKVWTLGTSQNFNGDQFYLWDATFNLPRLTIQPAGGTLALLGGNVGIFTTTPDQALSLAIGNASKPGGGSWLAYSDERLKNIKGRFTPGLKALMQLQPIRYEYKADNALHVNAAGEHIGFSAQAVEKVIPEAVTKNDQGYLLVNNDPIMWAMLNAFKEQQAQIEAQRQQIKQQASQLEGLKRLVCLDRPNVAVCKAAKRKP